MNWVGVQIYIKTGVPLKSFLFPVIETTVHIRGRTESRGWVVKILPKSTNLLWYTLINRETDHLKYWLTEEYKVASPKSPKDSFWLKKPPFSEFIK